ncbi:hypothetical protein ACJJIQ_15330 [Microbulbifer sp. ANSA003]|uniref:hypothetical protein n=1 Tax=Microbulbifer sp. ANSA003 TaxID=3243360 RepID=UPI0040433DBB
MHKLVEAFALDIAAYAVMSNHYHIVLYIDAESADKWSQGTYSLVKALQSL